MRRALCPVKRYNERINRARSSNHLSLSLKLPAQASPAPRSAHKERPAREGSCRENQSQATAPLSPEPTPEFANNPFLMADGVKKNPFLLADKAKAQARSIPTEKDLARWVRATPSKAVDPSLKGAPVDPRPIVELNEVQRAELQRKRECVHREKQQSCRAHEQPAPSECPPSPEPHEAHEEPETGVQVVPTSEAAAPSEGPVPQPEAAPAPATSKCGHGRKQALTKAIHTPQHGDLAFVNERVSTDLLAAVAGLLPNLEGELQNAHAVERTAEPLIDVVRRCRAQKSKRR